MKRCCALFLVSVSFLCSCSLAPGGGSLWSSSDVGAKGSAAVLSGMLEQIDQPPVKYPDLVVVDRPEVEKVVRSYMTDRRPFLEDALARQDQYLRIIDVVFDHFGLPLELASVAMVESRFRSNARSPRGAVGLWQFTKATGRAYGLDISLFQDERKDPFKASIAAAKYLSDLYDRFQDWHLAIAAYNGGPSRVSRAMRLARSDDFFEIAKKRVLRLETRNFVLKVLAVSKICSDLDNYGFDPKHSLTESVALSEVNQEQRLFSR